MKNVYLIDKKLCIDERIFLTSEQILFYGDKMMQIRSDYCYSDYRNPNNIGSEFVCLDKEELAEISFSLNLFRRQAWCEEVNYAAGNAILAKCLFLEIVIQVLIVRFHTFIHFKRFYFELNYLICILYIGIIYYVFFYWEWKEKRIDFYYVDVRRDSRKLLIFCCILLF